MSDYAFADIITGKDILTDQVREADIIGAKGYFTSDFKIIVDSFDDNTFPDPLLEGTFEAVSYDGRFKRKENGIYFDYFIRKKEPVKKYMPFDLSDPEVRKSLRGKWIKDGAGEEACITGFKCDDEEDWIAEIPNGYIAATALASCWMFDDNSPCGKLVEEE